MAIKIRRSTLIFPVNVQRFLGKAYAREADGICLDLEDSVPPSEKENARKLVRESIPPAARGGAEVIVRINNDPDLILEDIDASVYPGLDGIHLPKVESAEQIHRLDAVMEVKERERGLPPKSIGIALAVETPLGVLNAQSIAEASSRIVSMGVGPEDYYLALGVEPSEDGVELLYAASAVVTVCKVKKIRSTGILGSVAGFRDLDGFEKAALRGRQIGTQGSGCIHPEHVKILNRVFSPSPDSVEYSHRVVQAFEEGLQKGTASVGLDGKMVDIPVYYRAKIILERAEAIEAVEQRKAQALSLMK